MGEPDAAAMSRDDVGKPLGSVNVPAALPAAADAGAAGVGAAGVGAPEFAAGARPRGLNAQERWTRGRVGAPEGSRASAPAPEPKGSARGPARCEPSASAGGTAGWSASAAAFAPYASAPGRSPSASPPATRRRLSDAADAQPPRGDVGATHVRSPHSPALLTTKHLVSFYNRCGGFHYSAAYNPRRLLTKNGRACLNHNFDNEHNDLILYVNMTLEPTNRPEPAAAATAAATPAAAPQQPNRRFVVKDMLGSGTFGQVVRCTDVNTNRQVAVKVIKNQPAYYHQARVEISIVQMLNTRYDPRGERPIVRLLDYFVFQKHLCLVFEPLSVNLYELIKHNNFKGLSLNLVRVFLTQILQALSTLREASVVHCDLKPENILLRRLDTSGDVKLIDFGSACFTNKTVYSYVQSRFYRSPEVITCADYDCAIDMWSLGCVAAELFLGLPLFPGASEYNLLCRIVEMLGMPSDAMLDRGKEVWKYFYRKPARHAAPPTAPAIPDATDGGAARRMRAAGGLGGDVVVIGDGFVASQRDGPGAGAPHLVHRLPSRPPDHAMAAAAAAAATGSSMSRRAYVPSLPPSGAGALPPHPPPPMANTTAWAYSSATSGYVLMSMREYEARHGTSVAVGKRYFACRNLSGIIAPGAGASGAASSAENTAVSTFLDFLLGVLALDPRERWTPEQALTHPFITGGA